jgi:hypothetical protein
MHLQSHQGRAKLYFKTLGIFWGPVNFQCVLQKGWPSVGQILVGRLPHADTRLQPLDGDEAVDYWTETAFEEEDRREDGSEEEGEDEARVNIQARAREDQV